MIVARACYGDPQQILIFIHRLDDGGQKQKELSVFRRGVSRLQKIDAGVGGDRPVVVLAAAVDPVKGLFMEQTGQAMAFGNLFHDLHGQLVVVGGHVGVGEDRCQLMLGRGHLIVLGFR